MRPWSRWLAVTCVVLSACALTAGAALAAGGNAVINDCEANGRLTNTYTPQELSHALAVMPSSVRTYTNCYDVIEQALTSRTPGSGGAGSGGGGSFLPTPVIVILVVLVLGGVTFGALAIRRRRAVGADSGDGAESGDERDDPDHDDPDHDAPDHEGPDRGGAPSGSPPPA
ncbi:MAG: hypothetical protein ACLP50_32305 [Solirubrobacteraceae bacterium]